MAFRQSTFASAAAMAAALSMAATPAAAAELPRAVQGYAPTYGQVQPGAVEEANQYRRYRHRRHRNRGIDTGDVIAGVVVLGALAAIIGSSRSRDRDRDRDRYEERREQARYDQRDDRNYDSRGIENAVDMCIDQVERSDDRVDSVHEARRATDGWRVAGTLADGSGWDCWIDNDGRIRSIDFSGAGYSAAGEGRYSGAASASTAGQLSDAAYANARASTRTAADEPYSQRYETTATYDASAPVTPSADDPRPAYPGGPLPGEEGYDPDWQVDGDLDEYGG